MKKGRLELAMRHYTEALRRNPAYAEAHNGLAEALTKQGKLQEAIGHFDEALRIHPGDNKARKGREATLLLMRKSAPAPVNADGSYR